MACIFDAERSVVRWRHLLQALDLRDHPCSEGQSSDPKRNAAVQFARKVIETQGNVSDADLEAVAAAGHTGLAQATEVAIGLIRTARLPVRPA